MIDQYTEEVVRLGTLSVVLPAGRIAVWVAPRMKTSVIKEVEVRCHQALLKLIEERLNEPEM